MTASRSERARGSKNGCAKLTEADVPVIRREHQEGCTYRHMAAMHGVSDATIWRVIKNRNWSHVE